MSNFFKKFWQIINEKYPNVSCTDVHNCLIDKLKEITEICNKSKKSKNDINVLFTTIKANFLLIIYDSDNNDVTLNNNNTKVTSKNLYYILEPWYNMIKHINDQTFIENEILNFMKTLVNNPKQYKRLTKLTILYLTTMTENRDGYYDEIKDIIRDVYKDKKKLNIKINKSFDNMLYNYVNNYSDSVCEYILEEIKEVIEYNKKKSIF